MTAALTVTVTDIDGEPMLDTVAMALMLGVSEADVIAMSEVVGGRFEIPAERPRSWRRRAREALGSIRDDDLVGALEYWVQLDHAQLRVVWL